MVELLTYLLVLNGVLYFAGVLSVCVKIYTSGEKKESYQL